MDKLTRKLFQGKWLLVEFSEGSNNWDLTVLSTLPNTISIPLKTDQYNRQARFPPLSRVWSDFGEGRRAPFPNSGW